MAFTSAYVPDPRILELGDAHYDRVAAAHFPQTVIRHRDQRAAGTVGLDQLSDDEWRKSFGSFAALPNNLQQPLALRYHGHQFGTYNPMIGDGRGFLFAQLRATDGRLLDLGTKGSGTTPYSRGFDGRLTLQGGVREVLAASLLDAYRVPTCRILSLIETGEALQRTDEPSPTRGAVMVRLSHSHLRIGTFQRLAHLEQPEELARLVDHAIAHYVVDRGAPTAHPTEVLLASMVRAHADLVARQLAAGFVHGVLNTDNLNVTGESFDYGPWRFSPTWDPAFTAAYFDSSGYYAFGQQPAAVERNLRHLAKALGMIGDPAALARLVDEFPRYYEFSRVRAMLARWGLAPNSSDSSRDLVDEVLMFAAREKLSWDQLCFDLRGGAARLAQAFAGPASAHYRGQAFTAVRSLLERHQPVAGATEHSLWQRESPPTLVLGEVHRVWDAISLRDDWQPLATKLAAIDELRDALA